MIPLFRDRADAGRRLGALLHSYAGPQTRVLGLPRGGVPVAAEIAHMLNAPLDVFVVRKLGVPGHEELAMGAIASSGVQIINADTVASLGIDDALVQAVAERERAELERREAAYRGGLPAHDLAGKTVILVDDGVATGASMYAAIVAVRESKPEAIVVAVPVAPIETKAALERAAEAVVCVATPEPFRGVGAWYSDFSQTSDAAVSALLHAGAHAS